MGHKFVTMCGVMAVSATAMFADFSYHETSKITGGAMAGMMKLAGAFSKELKDAQESSVAIKGNKMVRRTAQRMSLIDLDAKTITEVDLQ